MPELSMEVGTLRDEIEMLYGERIPRKHHVLAVDAEGRAYVIMGLERTFSGDLALTIQPVETSS